MQLATEAIDELLVAALVPGPGGGEDPALPVFGLCGRCDSPRLIIREPLRQTVEEGNLRGV